MSEPRTCDGCLRPAPELRAFIPALANAGIEHHLCAACAAWLDPHSRMILTNLCSRAVERATALKDEPSVERAR